MDEEQIYQEHILSWVMDDFHSHGVAQILDSSGIAIRVGHHGSMPLHQRLGKQASSRASFYVYNALEEIERFTEGLERMSHFLRRPKLRAAQNRTR